MNESNNSNRDKNKTDSSQDESTFSAPPFLFRDNQARDVFRKWAQQQIFAPSKWKNKGDIQPTFIPFWLHSFTAKVVYTARVGTYENKFDFLTNKMKRTLRWTTLKGLQTKVLSYQDVPSYASTTFERQMVEKLVNANTWQISMNHMEKFKYTQQDEDIQAEEDHIDEDEDNDRTSQDPNTDYKIDLYTIDEDTSLGFLRNDWLDHQLRKECMMDLMENYPGYDSYDLASLDIKYTHPLSSSAEEKKARPGPRHHLYYYPVFVLENHFRGYDFNCFLDGRKCSTSSVVGYRQYSFPKVASALAALGNIGIAALLATDTIALNSVEVWEYLALTVGVPAMAGGICVVLPIANKTDPQYWNDYQARKLDKYTSRTQDERNREEAFGDTFTAGWETRDREETESHSFDADEQRRKFEKRYKYYDDYDVGESTDDFVGSDFEHEVRAGEDFYTMLGLNPDKHDLYTKHDIKVNYRRMALKWHPDMNKHPEAGKRFRELNQANTILSNSEKRMLYHKLGKQYCLDHLL